MKIGALLLMFGLGCFASSKTHAVCHVDELKRESRSLVGIALQAASETFQQKLTPMVQPKMNVFAEDAKPNSPARFVQSWYQKFQDRHHLRGSGENSEFEFLTYLFFLDSKGILCPNAGIELTSEDVEAHIQSDDVLDLADTLGYSQFHASMMGAYKDQKRELALDEYQQLSFLFPKLSHLKLGQFVTVADRKYPVDFWPSHYETGWKVIAIEPLTRIVRVTIEREQKVMKFAFSKSGEQCLETVRQLYLVF